MTIEMRAPLLAAAALAIAACGLRPDPRPPEDTMARAPEQVSAVRDGATVLVRWRSPGESVDGRRLIDLSRFVIERRTRAESFVTIGETAADTTHRLRPVRQYSYTDESPLDDYVEYRVVAYTADGERGVPSRPAVVPTSAAAGNSKAAPAR
jgi:hypothetical protein